MATKAFNPKDLDKIIADTVKAVEMGQQQIFNLIELNKSECLRTQEELEKLKRQIKETIDEVDKAEAAARRARVRLMEVHRDFQRYGEEEVRQAYEATQEIQIKLALLREQERVQRARREDVERQLRSLLQNLEKGEALASQMSLAAEYLKGSLTSLTDQLNQMQKRQEMAIRVIQAQEEERKRVAREIHDGPAQSMANVVLRTEVCERLWQVDRDRVLEELRGLKGIVRESLQEVRQIIFNLRPMALDDLGLIPTIRRYLEGLREKGAPEIEFSAAGHEGQIPSAYKAALFRIIQEALNNVIKHSQASLAQIRVEFTGDEVIIQVKDNGCGFSYEEVANGENLGHFGLLGMKERADLLNGSFNVTTAKGKGTVISVEVPLPDSEEVKENGRDKSFGR